MVEWLSQRVMHRPFVNNGNYISESTGLTFREQDEIDAKKTKICGKCKKKKTLDAFHKNKDGKYGRRSYCKECVKVYYKEKYIKDAEKYKWMAIERIYGVTEADYDRMFKEQKGCCAICGKHQSEFVKALCIDHNHKTEKVRGLLCKSCNLDLGVYEKRKDEFKKYLLIYE